MAVRVPWALERQIWLNLASAIFEYVTQASYLSLPSLTSLLGNGENISTYLLRLL